MAEGGQVENSKNTLPQRGKVSKVRQEWAVYEDGAFAQHLQEEEIDKHFGLNRFNRRTVRDDIPIAKVVQTDEEQRLQEERFEQLQALKAQAEEDERMAKLVMEQDQRDVQNNEAHKKAMEMTDEEYAKMVQDKEKKKYEKYLERKKQKQLKKEREQLELSQQQKTAEARLTGPVTGSTEGLDDDVANLHLQQNGGNPGLRVTPGGHIEDDGDFSDFYNLPNHIDPQHRAQIQELQDEELAKLLQEQEHKRTKAEVDRSKLREIEEQDKRLAEIIQEQEQLKLKKAKQKRKQQEETRKKQEQSDRPPALPPRNNEQRDLRRYRRDSFIMSMENGPADHEQQQLPNNIVADNSENSPESYDGYLVPIEAKNGKVRNNTKGSNDKNRQSSNGHAVGQAVRGGNSVMPNSRIPSGTSAAAQNRLNQSRVHGQNSEFDPQLLPSQEIPDVEGWLARSELESSRGGSSRGRLRSDSENYPESPSPPGSYHSNERFQHRQRDDEPCYAVSNLNFNIATAIDPTYPRRKHEIKEETEMKGPIHTASRSLPVDACTELEWDPGVRGSLRRGSLHRPRGTWNPLSQTDSDNTVSSTVSRDDSFPDDGVGGVSQFAPVQGHRRTTGADPRARKSKKQQQLPSRSMSQPDKQKGNCKQQ